MSPDPTANPAGGPRLYGRIVNLNADDPTVKKTAIAKVTGERHIDNAVHQSECASLVLHIGSKGHAIVVNGRVQIDRPAGINGTSVHVQ